MTSLIFKLTQDFLTYLHQMERLNIELAGEFILVRSYAHAYQGQIATASQGDQSGNRTGENPVTELVSRSYYRKYKEATELLRHMEDDRQKSSQKRQYHP
jgi:segregation and condensation protein A